MRRAEGTGDNGGGIPSGTIAAHVGMTRAEGSVVVIEMTESGIYETMHIEEGVLTMPGGVASVTTVQAKIFAVVKRTASVMGMMQRDLQRWIIRVEESGGDGEITVPKCGVWQTMDRTIHGRLGSQGQWP